MASPIYGVPEPGPDDTKSLWYQHLKTAIDASETYYWGRFPDAATRDAKISNPIRGMECFLSSPGYRTRFNGTRWVVKDTRTTLYRSNLRAGDLDLPGTINADGYGLVDYNISRPGEPYIVTIALNVNVAPNTIDAARPPSFRIDMRDPVLTRTAALVPTPTSGGAENATVHWAMPNGGDLNIVVNYTSFVGNPKLYAVSAWSVLVQPYGMND